MDSGKNKKPLKRALVLTSHQMGLADFCRILLEYDIRIYSIGEALKFLQRERVEVSPLCRFTGMPVAPDVTLELLHPSVIEALTLNDNNKKIPIDLLVCNFRLN